MAKTETHIPKLRFAGFADPWQKNKLKNIGKISIGGDVNQEAIQELGSFPVIANGLGNDGIVGFYDNYKIAAPAITISGRGVGIGFTKARFQNFTPVVRLIVLQAPNFDAYFLENNISRLDFFIESTGVPQLTAPQFGQYEIYYPSVVEQTKIGDFFQKIDQVIELQQKALDIARDYKKAMLQKMFPQKGEKVPKVRFDGFSGDWEYHTLDEITDRFDSLRVPISASERIFGNTPYYGANGIQGYVEGYTHDGENILIAEDGANDLVDYPIKYVVGKIWVNNHAHVLSAKASCDTKFLSYGMKNINFTPFLVGGGRAKLNANVMMQIKLKVPKIEEQQKIGAFFQKLDQQIEQHEKKLENYQQLKKAMLQRMFV